MTQTQAYLKKSVWIDKMNLEILKIKVLSKHNSAQIPESKYILATGFNSGGNWGTEWKHAIQSLGEKDESEDLV